jgi:hypothetical protein
MPDWLLTVLVAIFVIHLFLFSRRALQRHEAYYYVVCVTFLLLIVSFSIRLAGLQITIGSIRVDAALRIAAWITAAIGISLLLHRKFVRRAD